MSRRAMAVVEHPLLVLTPRPWKWLRILIICTLFLAIGCWMLSKKQGADLFMAWGCIVFSGLGVVISVLQLIPGTTRTVVAPSGLHVKTLFTFHSYAWADIECFGVVEWTQRHGFTRTRHRYVGIRFVSGSKHRKRFKRMKAFSNWMEGFHGILPDNYGYKHQELADLLNRYLESHKGSQTPG